MDNSDSSNNSTMQECKKCGSILTQQNCSRKGVKTCIMCLQNRREEIANLKIQKPNTKICVKCKLYKPNIEFIGRELKSCQQCRDNLKDKRKSKKDDTEDGCAEGSINGNYKNNIRGITALELYNYLCQKYQIKEDLRTIIKEIAEQEIELEEEEEESTEECKD